MQRKLSPNERARIRARSGCADETISNYPRVREASAMRIERAAAEEGIALKDPAPTSPSAPKLSAR